MEVTRAMQHGLALALLAGAVFGCGTRCDVARLPATRATLHAIGLRLSRSHSERELGVIASRAELAPRPARPWRAPGTGSRLSAVSRGYGRHGRRGGPRRIGPVLDCRPGFRGNRFEARRIATPILDRLSQGV